MGIIQKYSKSISSSNLKCDAYHFDTDNLAAVALSSALGSRLFRVKYAHDATSYKSLLEAWKVKVSKKAAHRRWPQHVSVENVAGTSLDYWLNDVCSICTGKGHLPLPGVPVLSDEPCPACHGTGKKPLSCEKRDKNYVKDMIEELEAMTRSAAARAMQKIAKDMDF